MKTSSVTLAFVAAVLLPCLVAHGQNGKPPGGSPPDGHDKQSVDDWISLTQSKDSDKRLHAARELGDPDHGAVKAVPALAKLLDDDLWVVRMEAALALGNIGPDAKAAVPRLAKSLTDRDVSVREAAYIALGQMGDDAKPAVPALVTQLGSRNRRTRELAAAGLGAIGPAAKGAPKLVELLGDNDPDVRDAARQAMSLIGAEGKLAVAAVRKLPNDKQGPISPRRKLVREATLCAMIERTQNPNLKFVMKPRLPFTIGGLTEGSRAGTDQVTQ